MIRIEEPPASVTLTTSATETIIAVPQPRAESLVAVAPVPAADTATLDPRTAGGRPRGTSGPPAGRAPA